MSNSKRNADLSQKLQQLENRVRLLEAAISAGVPAPPSLASGSPSVRASDLPNSLAKSLQAMQLLGEADATTVSQKTSRTRSVETIYLNQLVRIGILTRSRVGKKVFFHLAKVY